MLEDERTISDLMVDQIEFADVIVVNKSDLVTEEEMKDVMERISSINGLAKMHLTSHSKVPQLEGVLLDLHAYDNVEGAQLDFAAKGHSHLDSVSVYLYYLCRMSER